MSTVSDEFFNQNAYAAPQAAWDASNTATEVNERGILWLLFSFSGRTRRIDYWSIKVLSFLAYMTVNIGARFLFAQNPEHPLLGMILVASIVLFVWVSLATRIKRWHDRDKPGSWVFINIIPIVGPLWELIELGLLRGTPGDNEFGPDPLMQ